MTEWRDIPGYEGRYRISSDGAVLSLRRDIRAPRGLTRTIPERILTPWINADGYALVDLYDGHRCRHAAVHRLVAKVFIGDQPFSGAQVCHSDGDKGNNSVLNLRWDTASANARDQVRHGSHHEARRTECDHGHPYTDANTRIYRRNGSVQRVCRICAREGLRALYARRRASV